MNELTLEDQRLLTEFLGERFYEDDSSYWWCDHCQCEVGSYAVTFDERHDLCGYGVVSKLTRLDFSDWRVVGRLIEKATDITITESRLEQEATFVVGDVYGSSGYRETKKLAICHAVLAYIKEKKDVL